MRTTQVPVFRGMFKFDSTTTGAPPAMVLDEETPIATQGAFHSGPTATAT